MHTLHRREFGSPLGSILAGAIEPGASPHEPGGVCLLELGGADRRAREIDEIESIYSCRFVEGGESELLDRLESQVAQYFRGERMVFDLPLVTPGTRFQHDVWIAMRTIPLGHTATYGELARSIGKTSNAARAVGAASGRNRVSILIPCHRVVDLAYDASRAGVEGLRGYGGGIKNKQWLLDHERMMIGGAGLFESAMEARVRGRSAP